MTATELIHLIDWSMIPLALLAAWLLYSLETDRRGR